MFGKNYIFSLFSTSPVRPLQKQMESVQACVRELLPFFDAALAGDWERAATVQARISQLENEADSLKRELRLHLPKGMMLAMSRRDLLEVLTMQDRLANKAKDIAGLILGRKMQFPEGLGEPLREFLARSIDASAQAQKAIDELDELVETGFRGREVELVEEMIHRLDAIENDTDRMQVGVRARLLEQERSLPPVDVMFLYRVIDWIGELADDAQRVGSRLELMLAQ